MSVPNQLYAPHLGHGIPLSDLELEVFDAEPDEYDLAPYVNRATDNEDDDIRALSQAVRVRSLRF